MNDTNVGTISRAFPYRISNLGEGKFLVVIIVGDTMLNFTYDFHW